MSGCQTNSKLPASWLLLLFFGAADVYDEQADLQDDERISAGLPTPDDPQQIAEDEDHKSAATTG